MGVTPLFWGGSADCAPRLDQVARVVGRATAGAIVSILIRRMTARATSEHETIGEEDPRLRIEELRDLALVDTAPGAERLDSSTTS